MGFVLGIVLLVGLGVGVRALLFSRDLSRGDVAGFAFETLHLPDGMAVNVRRQGDPAKRAMVLIHGGGDSLSVWDPWIAEMGDRFHFIAVDLPGHGLSDGYADGVYSTERFAEFVADVVTALDLSAFVIVGHSFGGKTVLRYVLAHPEAPAAMVLCSPGGYTDADCLAMPRPVAEFAQSGIGRRMLRRFGARGLFERFQYAKFFHDRTEIADRAIARQFRLFRLDKNRGVLVGLVSHEALRDEDLDGVGALSLPSMVLLGREDQIVSLSAGLRLAGDLPNAEHVVFDAMGHMGHIEITETHAAAAGEFLARRGLG